MPTIQVYGANVGGLIQGEFGNYGPAADGTYVIDSRDLFAALRAGAALLIKSVQSYTLPGTPIAATAGAYIASVTLSNATLTIAAQPDVPRQAQFILGNGTGPITAGSIAVTYFANDGTTQVDTISAVLGASASSTFNTSKGVSHFTSVIASGIVGGTSPFIYAGPTSVLTLPVAPGATDFAVQKENVSGVDEAVGTLTTGTLGGITPTSVPNGTRTYSFLYSFFGPAF